LRQKAAYRHARECGKSNKEQTRKKNTIDVVIALSKGSSIQGSSSLSARWLMRAFTLAGLGLDREPLLKSNHDVDGVFFAAFGLLFDFQHIARMPVRGFCLIARDKIAKRPLAEMSILQLVENRVVA